MTETKLYYGEMDYPVGTLLIISDGNNIVRIDYGTMDLISERIDKWAKRYFGKPTYERNQEMVHMAMVDLDNYFSSKKKDFSFAFFLHGTSFQKKVWQALYNQIPYGETKTYKEIADIIGNPKAVRAVGGAINKNPLSILVPCHRVIGTNGKLVGYNGGLDKKDYLLKLEKGIC